MDGLTQPGSGSAAEPKAVDVPPMSDALAPSATQGRLDPSIAIPISPRGWIWVIAVTVVCLWCIPRFIRRYEQFEPTPHWRMPTRYAEDLELTARRLAIAGNRGEVIWLGDSVIWGEYARPSETLPASMEKHFPSSRFANLGLEGLHPLALHGLVELFPQWQDRAVIIHFNPIWMTSPRRDLRVPEVGTINHVALLPQFRRSIPAYTGSWEDRIATWLGREVSLWRWTSHMRMVYFEGRDPVRWMTEHPTQWPAFAEGSASLIPDDAPSSRTRRRVVSANAMTYDWIAPGESLQFAAFVELLEFLARHQVRCYCIVGRLGPAGRTSDCLVKEAELRGELQELLERLRIPFHVVSNTVVEMADASHPTPAGYQVIAQELAHDPTLIEWLGEHGTAPSGSDP